MSEENKKEKNNDSKQSDSNRYTKYPASVMGITKNAPEREGD